MERAVLVYQAGIANVFEVARFNCGVDPKSREAKRLMQADFKACAHFAQGLAAAGVQVRTMHCNQAGDIVDSDWSSNLDEAPFREHFIVVNKN